MEQASAAVRAQFRALAIDLLEGRLDWGDFLESLPEGIGDDEALHELIGLLEQQPPLGLVSEEAYAAYGMLLREKIAAL